MELDTNSFQKNSLKPKIQKEARILKELIESQSEISDELKEYLKKEIKILERLLDTEQEVYKEEMKKQLQVAFKEVIAENNLKIMIRRSVATEVFENIDYFKKEIIKKVLIDKVIKKLGNLTKREMIRIAEKIVKKRIGELVFKMVIMCGVALLVLYTIELDLI